MKKISLIKLLRLATIFILSVNSVQAQHKSTKDESNFGFRAGVVLSDQHFSDGTLIHDTESKFGADLALLCTLPIGSGLIALQPELHWIQKGSTFRAINGVYFTNTVNYIELPVLLRFNFGSSLKLFAFGGPSAGYLIGVSSEDDIVSKNEYEDFEFSLHVGAGIGLGSFEIDLRYMTGLSDVSSDEGSINDIKNSALGAGITLKF